MSNEIPAEVLDLVRFLADAWSEVDSWAYKHGSPEALSLYPVIQTTSNQLKLARIGRQPYNTKNLKLAVEWMLAQEDASDGKEG